MATLRGVLRDADSGDIVAAKVCALNSGGHFVHPHDSLLKVGPGDPFFYCSGEFNLHVGRGAVEVVVERGTEYEPLRHRLYVPAGGQVDIELNLRRWVDLPERKWYPGNTHIHYNELETRPDDRLRLEPEVNDLNVTAISILQRGELPYASNKYPVGFMTDFSTDHRQVDCGEETRHNSHHGGYGHVMLLNLRNLVDPVSRGDLVSAFDPDYPPLCYACDDARTQGGLVIWCHNGNGLEAPVAAALGKLDAFNLFDPCWKELEYDIWYRLLNCGIALPASTGSDWYVCSNNRVYVNTEAEFSYASWLEGLRAGRTFITNGPALLLQVDGQGPGAHIPYRSTGSGAVEVQIEWCSHYILDRVELIQDGQVIQTRNLIGGEGREGVWHLDVSIDGDGWLAARAWGLARDSFAQSVYAHSSPIYIGTGIPVASVGRSAKFFADRIAESVAVIGSSGRFANDEQRQEVIDLFERGRSVYANMSTG